MTYQEYAALNNGEGGSCRADALEAPEGGGAAEAAPVYA